MSWSRRFLNLFRTHRVSEEIDREMSFHVAERADELMANGLSEADAMREAKRRFGNIVYQKESTRDANILTWLETLWSDLRYGTRALLASPLFAIIAILSLALGIGANTAIFSLINAVMLKSLPVQKPEELVRLTFGAEEDASDVVTNPIWEAVRDRQDVFSGIFAYGDNTFNLAESGERRTVPGNYVSAQFFSTLGVRPALGRLLDKTDDFRGCPGAVVLGYDMWQREYGGASNVLGRSISIEGHRFPIIGVAQKGFFGVDVGRSVDTYVPVCAEAVIDGPDNMLDRRSTWWMRVIGRPAEGKDLDMVRARLSTLAPAVFQSTVPANWAPDNQAEYLKRKLYVVPSANGLSYLRNEYSSALLALMVIVALVLVIACANVANLLLARATARQREVSIRLAIGAGRGRLVRQLLTESILLSAVGACVGILFARWGTSILVGFLSNSYETVWLDLSVDRRVLLFTIGMATVTGILFGMAPAWRSARVSPQEAMKTNSRTVVEGQSRFGVGKLLVVAQIALSLMLVMGAALLLSSFRTLSTMDPGFDKENVLIATVDMSTSNLEEDRQRPMYQDLLRRARSLPGVQSGAAAVITPVSGSSWNDEIVVDGFNPKDVMDAVSWMNQVSEGFFDTYGTQLVAGRDFNSSDVPGSPSVAIVTEAFAKHYYGTTNVLGKHFATKMSGKAGPPIEIVGVVRDMKYNDLKKPMEPIAFTPMNQVAAPGSRLKLSLRSRGDAADLIAPFKAMIAQVDPKAALEFRKLETQIAESITREKLLATLSGFFGGLALLLAMIGLYGIMAYNVARRRGEIGIRMALGSARIGVMRMVLREVSGMVVAGVLIGGIGVFMTMKLLTSFLFGLAPTDPEMLAASAVTLAVVALAAGAIPAWRAGRVDPMNALREE